jgi:hypothetical protein
VLQTQLFFVTHTHINTSSLQDVNVRFCTSVNTAAVEATPKLAKCVFKGIHKDIDTGAISDITICSSYTWTGT